MKEERNEIAEAALRRFAVDSERSTHLADRTAAECGALSAHVRANESLRLVLRRDRSAIVTRIQVLRNDALHAADNASRDVPRRFIYRQGPPKAYPT
ncbi:hypothetical protein L0Y81_01180 [Burkholderia multivorans]|uniref:hypothetical protein n=1 Tax=Burkholderia multivorans TaxID=87883 RepID=UPI001589C4AB|nr:hypothetical protein [Burkholderia multivorans]MBR8455041.1 hypothetical protein [Burkholderia multivorans]MBU9451229.1 hypothetical protein [Burkholderia multivorans]MCL4643434.1 hypothetical protein [Burkholderia multivorans]UQN85982.1 hypothetical protein L0Y85_01110 [Burkholderia multivorans]UQO71184.1 hypothetical protein L0Y81_01180 [Burkholderia multivorans]